jgi:hypothetical protein
MPKNPAAEAGPQHRDFEAGLPGGRHEGRCRSLFRRYRLKLRPVHPRQFRLKPGLPAVRLEGCFRDGYSVRGLTGTNSLSCRFT